jgi:ribosomal protein S6E (S10)
MARDYKKEYENYQGKPEQIKKRAMRNAARATMVKKGLAKKGDGKDVDHVKPLVKGGTNKTGLRMKSASDNRSYPRTKSAGMK